MVRRTPLRICAALLALAAATLTGFSATATARPQGSTKLVMWWWGDQEAAGLKGFVAASIKRYEAAHPGIKIEAVLQSTDNLLPNFAAAAKAKKGPDIIYRWGGIWSLQDAWDGNLAPLSDYLGKAEMSHYLNAGEETFDGKVWTAPWYLQPSFPVLYRKDVLKKAGIASAPKNWTQLMGACKALRAKNITPMAGGIKDGWFGGWLYSILGSQSISSIDDVKKAVTGTQKFSDPNQAAWWTKLQEMVTNRCWNDDIGSKELYQAQQDWSDGKAAMTITAGTDVRKFVKAGGGANVGLMAMPSYAKGIGAGKLGATSQTLGVSSFSSHKQEAADFIKYFHTPAQLTGFYKATGALPADDRFNSAVVTVPQIKQLFALAKKGGPYLENFIPTDLDAKANFANAQLIFAGKLTGKQAADDTEKKMARIRLLQPKLIANFKKWYAQ